MDKTTALAMAEYALKLNGTNPEYKVYGRKLKNLIAQHLQNEPNTTCWIQDGYLHPVPSFNKGNILLFGQRPIFKITKDTIWICPKRYDVSLRATPVGSNNTARSTIRSKCFLDMIPPTIEIKKISWWRKLLPF